jgi:hypothetical protein
MADPPGYRRVGETATQYFRRRRRRDYLTEYEHERRTRAKAEGARRVDVTLSGQALDDYAIVRLYVEGLNRWFAEHPMRLSNGESVKTPPIRLSDSEIITMALSRAASAIHDDDDQAAKAGLRRFLHEGQPSSRP